MGFHIYVSLDNFIYIYSNVTCHCWDHYVGKGKEIKGNFILLVILLASRTDMCRGLGDLCTLVTANEYPVETACTYGLAGVCMMPLINFLSFLFY